MFSLIIYIYIYIQYKLNLKINGFFSDSESAPILRGVDFLYNYAITNNIEGIYLSDAINLNELEGIFSGNGYTVQRFHEPFSTSLPILVKKLFTDSFLSKAKLCAMIGLIFCFSYLYLMFYRDSEKNLWIHHIFGLSQNRILIQMGVAIFVIILSSIFLFNIFLTQGLSYMAHADLAKIRNIVIVFLTFLYLAVNSIGLLNLMRSFKKREN